MLPPTVSCSAKADAADAPPQKRSRENKPGDTSKAAQADEQAKRQVMLTGSYQRNILAAKKSRKVKEATWTQHSDDSDFMV